QHLARNVVRSLRERTGTRGASAPHTSQTDLCLPIASELLQVGDESLIEVDIGRAIAGRAFESERLPADAEAGIGPLVLAEDFQQQLIGMSSDDGIERNECQG